MWKRCSYENGSKHGDSFSCLDILPSQWGTHPYLLSMLLTVQELQQRTPVMIFFVPSSWNVSGLQSAFRSLRIYLAVKAQRSKLYARLYSITGAVRDVGSNVVWNKRTNNVQYYYHYWNTIVSRGIWRHLQLTVLLASSGEDAIEGRWITRQELIN